MVIAEVCNYAPNYGGNFIASLLAVEEYVARDNSKSRLIFIFPQAAANKEWVKELMKGHTVHFLSNGMLRSNMELLKWCKDDQIDILHTHFYGLITGCIVGWFTKTNVIHHVHNTWEKPTLFKSSLHRLLASSCKKMVGCSRAVYDTLLHAGFPSRKCMYITNCIDFKRLDNEVNSNPYDNGKNNILILGSDFYRKGVDQALYAVGRLYRKWNLQLNIIAHDKNVANQNVINTIGELPSWVSVIDPVENIGDYYKASALFLSPSLAEGLCYAVPEALYCECMVLKTNIPSQTYELPQESFVTLNNIEELSSRIECFLEMDANVSRQIICDLKKQVVKKYSLSNWGEKMFSLYSRL